MTSWPHFFILSLSCPGLQIVASLRATQVNFLFLYLFIQTRESWPSIPILITLQASAEYSFSFCIKYSYILVLFCPASSLSFPCLFLPPCWNSASCCSVFKSGAFPFEAAGAKQELWSFAKRHNALQCTSVLISQRAALCSVPVLWHVGMHHTPTRSTFFVNENWTVQQVQEL